MSRITKLPAVLLLVAASSAGSCSSRNDYRTIPPHAVAVNETFAVATGSWHKEAGNYEVDANEPNVYRIDCSSKTMTCLENGAWVQTLPSSNPALRLLPAEEYRVTSWSDGVVVAEKAYSNVDVMIRISGPDGSASKTTRGTTARGVRLNAGEWSEEILK